MTRIDQSALLPYTAQQMFDLVNDIESYPRFMDGCMAATILDKDAAEVTARLELGKGGLKYAFTTRNELVAPTSMNMVLVDGPFRLFTATWQFLTLGDNACKVSLQMEFEFASGLVDVALRLLFESTSRNLVSAVCRRADQLYGGIS